MTVALGVILLKTAFGVYLAATVCYFIHLASKSKSSGFVGTGLLLTGVAVHTASLVVRAVAAERPPFMSVYEFILSFTLTLVVIYLSLEFTTGNKILGVFHMPLITLFAFVATRMSSEVNPTMPALRSVLRVPHISAALMAYAAFGSAFILAIEYMIQARAEARRSSFWPDRLPSSQRLDQVVYRTVAFGFVLLTFAIVMGAVWAQAAWGKYWSWDNKEVWSAITWLIYAAYLHTRTSMGWRGSRSAIVAIVGFTAAMFTLLGVSYLLPSMHGYAK